MFLLYIVECNEMHAYAYKPIKLEDHNGFMNNIYHIGRKCWVKRTLNGNAYMNGNGRGLMEKKRK